MIHLDAYTGMTDQNFDFFSSKSAFCSQKQVQNLEPDVADVIFPNSLPFYITQYLHWNPQLCCTYIWIAGILFNRKFPPYFQSLIP